MLCSSWRTGSWPPMIAQLVRRFLCKHKVLCLTPRGHRELCVQPTFPLQYWEGHRLVLGVHWLASLAYLASSRLERQPVSAIEKKKNLELSSGFHVCLGTCAHIYVHVYLYNAHRETISMVLISHNSDTFEGHSHFTNEKNWDSEAKWLDSDLSLEFSRSLIYIANNSSMCS